MAVDPRDVDRFQTALNDAAGKATLLWTAFVTFQLYLITTIGSVTHKALLLETPLKLPVLAIDLPLVGFFAIAPLVLLIFHGYLFLQLMGMAELARKHNEFVVQEFPHAKEQELVKLLLDPFAILQLMAGPSCRRTGFPGFLLNVLMWTTLVVGPIVTLLFAQIIFLPYHGLGVIWLIRLYVVGDVALVIFAWNDLWRPSLHGTVASIGGLAAAAAVAIFSVFVAAFPGERIRTYVPSLGLREWLFASSPEGEPNAFFSDRLIVPHNQIVDLDSLTKNPIALSLRGRDLRNAILSGSDLRKTDLNGANLDGAYLVRTTLDGSELGCLRQRNEIRCASLRDAALQDSSLTNVSAEGAQLQGANLNHANFESSDFRKANFSGASLDRAYGAYLHFHDAIFSDASLRDVSFETSWARGNNFGEQNDFSYIHANRIKAKGARFGGRFTMANFDDADLRSSSFDRADLTLASIKSADLRGSNFESAIMVGVDLKSSRLVGADFAEADLEAASFASANLKLAFFMRSRMQGANLEDADLSGALMLGSCVWHTIGSPKTEFLEIEQLDKTTPPQGNMFGNFEHLLEYRLQNVEDRGLVENEKKALSLLEEGSPQPPQTTSWDKAEASQGDVGFGIGFSKLYMKTACEEDPSYFKSQLSRISWSNHLDGDGLYSALSAARRENSCKGVHDIPISDWIFYARVNHKNLHWMQNADPAAKNHCND